MMPGRSIEITGAWLASTVKSLEPGITTCSTSTDIRMRSGLTSSNLNVAAIV